MTKDIGNIAQLEPPFCPIRIDEGKMPVFCINFKERCLCDYRQFYL